jgi:hypothetical protein
MLMRKVYLFLAGALLFSLPAVSQMQFQRHADDPRVIFHQNFEATEGLSDAESYRVWSTTPIDTILELEYYAKLGNSTPRSVDIYSEANAADWSIFAVRTDSVSSEHPETSQGVGIVIFNGVETSSSASEKANQVYDNDSYSIINDGGTDADRNAAFAQYGETGGKSFFKYTTGGIDASKISSSHYSTTTHSTKNYRRDLYVRGLDIEDESSYRLTFYIKTKKLNTWGPLFYADLMRGYHHQRAPFSMGYKSGKDFSFSMDEFEDGKWQKVTVMNYYLNDREADGYVIYKGDYSWTDDWTWRPSDEQLASIGKTLAPGEVLNYVKQPDKYFVRFSFATDSVEYSLDNLTLTKSWIGGVEYNEDVLRINFGYETNLDELVADEKARTNIPAVSIPNVNYKSFEVWYKKGDQIGLMPIRSAEYHDDGYMYMFTEYYPVDPTDPDGEKAPLKFGDYDSVFVTFHNPVDMPELTLKYNGSLYPKALDEEWVAAGKIVPDFYNEIATPNPNCNKTKQKVGNTTVIKNVVSIDGLPPILNKAPFEDGAFGLDANTKTLAFKFQKELKIDDVFTGENTKDTQGVIAYVGTEVWEPAWDDATSSLVITRPDTYTANPLQGDRVIHIVQIKGTNGDEGEEVVLNYHFGDFATRPAAAAEYTHSDWRSTLTDPTNNGGCVAVGTWSHSYDSSKEQFERGEGQEAASTKNRLYLTADAGLDNCGYYVSPRNSSGNSKVKYSGNLFAVVNLTMTGGYTIKFKAAEWWNSKSAVSANVETHLYIYPKPSGDEADFTFSTFTDVQDKVDLGSIEPTTHVLKDDIKDKSTGTWPADVETLEYAFNISKAGEYIIEWKVNNTSNSSNGLFIGNYTIGKSADSDLSTAYVKKLINAVASAQAKLDASSDEKYKGEAFKTLGQAVADGDKYKGNFPSQYDSVVAYINASVKEMNLRIDTVNLFHSTEADVASLLASFVGDSAKYKALAAYTALENHKNANAGWIDSVKATRTIGAEIEAYKAEMDAIDDRMELIAKFNDKLKETKAIIDDANARKDYDEYATMTTGYNTALAQDLITPADSMITKATADLNAAKNVYVFRYDYEIAKTRQIKELYTLADALGYDFAGFGGNKDSIKNYVNSLADDDPELAEILREAAILQINKAYAENDPDKIDKLLGMDVSALIPNYFFYNEAQVDRDMEKNSSGVWRVKREALTTAIPGWTFTPSSGNWYFVHTDIKDAFVAGSYMDWEADGHTFIGGLRSGTSTQGIITADIEGLPEGYYKVGLYAYNQTSDLAFEFTTDSVTYDGKVNTVMNGGSKFNFKEVGIDSVLVAGNLTYTINQKSSSSSEFELRNAVLRLGGINPACNYAAVVTALETKLSELITVVDAPAMGGSSVQYYNLGGMQIDAPKAGEIVIRKTVKGGKVTVDKVLIK